MYPHRIRLRGPWECTPIAADGSPAPAHRVILPCRWFDAGLAEHRGLARFTRKFGYPGRIDEGEHVWLTCAGSTDCRAVRLNDQPLGQDPGEVFAFDVTAVLSQRNQLELLIAGASDAAGVWGEVALEIRRAAYLTEMRVQIDGPHLRLTGKVAGTAPHALELYVLVDGRHADYRTIVPSAAGEPFELELPDGAAAGQLVRVELVQVSAIWYIVELPIPHWPSR